MQRYQIDGPFGLQALRRVEAPSPEPDPGEVLVDFHAWSLNSRDLAMLKGGYPRNDKVKTAPPMVPLSDGAGVVTAVGSEVTQFQPGDRVAAIFFQDWLSGELDEQQIGSALGGAIDGVLTERKTFPERGLVKIPDSLTFEQAACLPCAAVTAWQALTLGRLRLGQTVLLLGTGGVSVFALQFAKAGGARVLMTSSSNEKLERAQSLGVDVGINYKTHPEWDREVLRATDGVGVDHVIEVGGAGTFAKSLSSVRVSGRVSLIGVLSRPEEGNPSPLPALFKRLTVQGIYVGSREMFLAMNQAIVSNALEPVIDRVFDFSDAPLAYEYLQSGSHFGKVVIRRQL